MQFICTSINRKSCITAWKLLYLLSLHIKPSQEIYPFIMYHCLQNALPLEFDIIRCTKPAHFAAIICKYIETDLSKQV